jgi:hypothetical protein
MNEGKSETASSYSGEGDFRAALQACDHKGHYRLAGGVCVAIRMCINCGKSWRMWTKPEYNDYPVAEWEDIKEPVVIPELVAGDYDEDSHD